MNPPMNGASSGPAKTVMLKTVMASPRSLLENMSANTAPTQARGQAPKNPPKKRQMKTVCRSLATATPIEKMLKPNDEMRSGHFRPYYTQSRKGQLVSYVEWLRVNMLTNSDIGAQKRGPVAKPRT